MKKILFAASTLSHIRNFHLPYLEEFHRLGYEVWVATNSEEPVVYADHVVALPFAKKLLSRRNIKAIFMARKLFREQKFDLISTHTALASAVLRAAVLLLPSRPKVFCTVHGYLFHESDGLRKWIYLIPEKICSHVTDVLMVMNHEDYDIAQKHGLYAGELHYISGMGIRLGEFKPAAPEERLFLRKKLKLSEDDFVYVYAAEFSERKNQAILIHAFAEVSRENSHMKLLLAGDGVLLEECRNLARRLHADDRILFPGHVDAMRELYSACNACVSVSRIEGLPFNVMEALACGLPVIASDIKGHRELVANGKNGVLFPAGDFKALKCGLLAVYENPGNFVGQCDLSPFDLETVRPQIIRIYREAGR